MQSVLILSARQWTPTDGRPTQFYLSVGTLGASGQVETSDMAVGASVYSSVSAHAPCFAEAELGIAGSFKGQPKLTLTVAKPVGKLTWPAPKAA